MNAKKILVVEDDLALSAGLCFELDTSGYLTVAAYGCRTDFAEKKKKKECGGNRQWQNHYLRNWAANTKGKGIT